MSSRGSVVVCSLAPTVTCMLDHGTVVQAPHCCCVALELTRSV